MADAGNNNASLQYAFIFDRRLGVADESAGEQEKLEQVLFFWPPQTSAFQQIMRISLCSGVLDFCHSFSGAALVDGVQMEEQYYTFYECEKDIWMVWVVSNPRKLEFGGRRGPVLSKTESMRNIFQPSTLREQLQSMHAIYRLFHGSIRSNIAPDGDLSVMHDLMAKRRALRKALEMQEKLDDGAVTRTEGNLARAAQAPALTEELREMEATSTVTEVRRQLRQIVSQFLSDEFVQRWDHHPFTYQRAVSRCSVERFTFLSVQYFASTVKTGLDGMVQNLVVFNENDLIWSDYDERVLDLICTALQSPAMARSWSQSERMSLPFLLESNGHVMARRIILDQSSDEKKRSQWADESSSDDEDVVAASDSNVQSLRQQVLIVYYQAPMTICLGVDTEAWDNQWPSSTDDQKSGNKNADLPPKGSESPTAAGAAASSSSAADPFNPPLCSRIVALIKPELRKLSKLIERHKKAQSSSSSGADGAVAKLPVRYIVKNLNNNRIKLYGFERNGSNAGGNRRGTGLRAIKSFSAIASIAPQLTQEVVSFSCVSLLLLK
eukprot:INCI19694.2.p1 GENE.INCI19694.2~~INCI19694.2.p1  ORF type:complete len:552 (-),score=107.42 INCI19694.2:459-2114(-)